MWHALQELAESAGVDKAENISWSPVSSAPTISVLISILPLQELAEFRQESTELKNQGVTIRRLEERARELEAALAEKASTQGLLSCGSWL